MEGAVLLLSNGKEVAVINNANSILSAKEDAIKDGTKYIKAIQMLVVPGKVEGTEVLHFNIYIESDKIIAVRDMEEVEIDKKE